MPKGIPNKRHTGEFKQQVVEYMQEHKLSCVETAKIFDTDHKNVALWERIHLTYGAEGLYLERRRRGGKGKPPKPPKQVEEDLIAENQRLCAENDYVKRIDMPQRDEHLAGMVRECQHRCGETYGYRRIHIWLIREKSLNLNPKTVLKVMNKYGLLSEIRRRRKYKVMGEQVHKYPIS